MTQIYSFQSERFEIEVVIEKDESISPNAEEVIIRSKSGYIIDKFDISHGYGVSYQIIQNQFLVLGLNGQGLVIYDLKTLGYKKHWLGDYWFGGIKYYPKTRTLMIDGCHWGAPHCIWIWSVDDPMNAKEICMKEFPHGKMEEVDDGVIFTENFLSEIIDTGASPGKWSINSEDFDYIHNGPSMIKVETPLRFKLDSLGFWTTFIG